MSRKGGKQRNKLQVENDRQQIVELYLKGFTQAQIAEALDLHQTMVSKELASIREKWQQVYLIDFNEKQGAMLEMIDDQEEKYIEGYERTGDIKFLIGIDRCIDMRIKIFGLYGRQMDVRTNRETVTFPEGDIEKQTPILMRVFNKNEDEGEG
jgi:hypothetical protein